MSDAPKWYSELITKVNNLAEEFGLDDFSTSKLREFVTTIAKDQFKVGNKSGIRWAYTQMEQKNA